MCAMELQLSIQKYNTSNKYIQTRSVPNRANGLLQQFEV